jgi:hypothetical protein
MRDNSFILRADDLNFLPIYPAISPFFHQSYFANLPRLRQLNLERTAGEMQTDTSLINYHLRVSAVPALAWLLSIHAEAGFSTEGKIV